jgi:hydroxymethylpyrimidine pyrophosphatase-like HAD family hydrolase
VEGTRRAKIVTSWDRAGDIIPSDSGKGTGIRKILEHYRLTPEEAMAFGDGNNDVEMLQAVGTGIAMGNATQQLKAVADGICDPVSRDGVYHYCLQQGLL